MYACDKGSKTQKTVSIKKTCLYNFDPLKPYFYIIQEDHDGPISLT